jgi:hypothetical protein
MNKNKNTATLNDNKIKKHIKIYKKCDMKIIQPNNINNLIKPVIKNKNQILVTF